MDESSSSLRSKDGDPRLKFAERYGIDCLLFIRNCFIKAPLVERAPYWDELVKALRQIEGVDGFWASEKSFEDVLKEYQPICDVKFDEKSSVALLPPGFRFCPRGCRDAEGTKQQLSAPSHAPVTAVVYELDGTKRQVHVLRRRCKTCKCVLEYDMVYTPDGYQFYASPQPYLRITPNVYFSRPLCQQIVRKIARGRETFESFADNHGAGFAIGEFDRKWASIAFYRHEVEDEIRSRGMITTLFRSYNSFDDVLPTIEQLYANEGFPHVTTDRCTEYMCDFITVFDGIWSITFEHCAAVVINTVEGLEQLNLPPVCPLQPENGSLYCKKHAAFVEAEKPCSPPAGEEVSALLASPDIQVFVDALRNCTHEVLALSDKVPFHCRKNLGAKPAAGSAEKDKPQNTTPFVPSRRPRSRGYLVLVRSCGHIEQAIPIFKAESPSQVVVIVLSYLYRKVQELKLPQEDFHKVCLIYDNMCNIARMNALKQLLPFPPPYDKLWMLVTKLIDKFHLSNHRRPECRTLMDPSLLYQIHPNLKKRNTGAGEQTFAWMARHGPVLKKIPRNRQRFYVYRLCKHRNSYLCSSHAKRSELLNDYTLAVS